MVKAVFAIAMAGLIGEIRISGSGRFAARELAGSFLMGCGAIGPGTVCQGCAIDGDEWSDWM
jgi:hypothetical protein